MESLSSSCSRTLIPRQPRPVTVTIWLMVFLGASLVSGQDDYKYQCIPGPGLQSGDPTIPTLPNQFQTRIEANIRNTGNSYSVDANMYYDYDANMASFMFLRGQETDHYIYDFDKGQILTINGNDVNSLKHCTVGNMTLLEDTMYFQLIGFSHYDNGTYHVKPPGDTLWIGKQFGETYVGLETVRGIPAYHWFACIDWEDNMDAHFRMDWWFSQSGWDSAESEDQPVPLRAVIDGDAENLTPHGGRHNFTHNYEFIGFKPRITHHNALQAHSGSFCPGLVNAKPLPKIGLYFSYIEEMVFPKYGYIKAVGIYYDSVLRLTRYDYTPDVSAAPYYTTNPMSEIHDWNTGVKYVIDQIYGNCTMSPLGNDTIDVERPPSPDYWLNNDNSVALRSPREMFYLDDTYIYMGQRTYSGILCDVWSSMRSDFAPPDQPTPYEKSLFEFYFMADGWTENEHSNLQINEPVMLSITVYTKGEQSTADDLVQIIYNYYDYYDGQPSIRNYDISPCFRNLGTNSIVRIDFNASFILALSTMLPVFQEEVKAVVLQTTGISPLRLQDVSVYFTWPNTYVVLTMLERPAFLNEFHRTQSIMKIDSQAKLVRVDDVGMCATACVQETDFSCLSFDYCSGQYCYLSRTRSHSDKEQTDPAALPCDHYVYNIADIITPEPNNSVAIQKLTDAQKLGLLNVQLPVNASLFVSYSATAITADLSPGSDIDTAYRDRFYTITPTWYDRRITGSAAKRTIKGISLSDCRTQCINADSFECDSFSQCHSECILSDVYGPDIITTPGMWTVDSGCTLFSRYYTDSYVKSPGKVLPVESDNIISGVTDVQYCARNCTKDTDCKSFEFCPSLRECAFHITHVADVPVEDLRDKIGCDHYSKNYFSDFERVNTGEYELKDAEVYMGVSVVDCAKYCVDETKFICSKYLYCAADGANYCLLPTDLAPGQAAPDDKATCDEYKRVYFPTGTKFTVPTSPDNSGFTPGQVGGIAVGLLVVGVILGVGIFLLVSKLTGGNIIDSMNLGIVKNEEVNA